MGSTITIDFHGDPLAVIIDDARGEIVPVRPLVTGMGLDWSAQYRRLMRHPILGKAVVVMATTASPAGDKDGVCLPLDLVPGFLFGISAERIADEAIRVKVIAYQAECFRVLARACLSPARAEAAIEAPVAGVPLHVALRLVAEARRTHGPAVARELWAKLGSLPVVPLMRAGPPQSDLFIHERGA